MLSRKSLLAHARQACAEVLESRVLFADFQPATAWSPHALFDDVSDVRGMTANEVRAQYGINDVRFGNVIGDGAGQTIAIIAAYDHPGFVDSTDPNYAQSDLAVFSRAMGLPDPPSFKKIPAPNSQERYADPQELADWRMEIALDIEWAHAMAPRATRTTFPSTKPSDARAPGTATFRSSR
jgi:hypothetical protein